MKATLTADDIQDVILSVQYHVFPGTTLTVCCITLKNGFTVTGESACVTPAHFNQQMGEDLAYAQAKNKIWQLEGYLLKQKRHEEDQL